MHNAGEYVNKVKEAWNEVDYPFPEKTDGNDRL
jgi:hypothetical protein